nr:hypothetical protein [Tanacetum cinerariifolium]
MGKWKGCSFLKYRSSSFLSSTKGLLFKLRSCLTKQAKAHNTQQQLALQNQDGDHTMNLSNICNLQQPDSSFAVPTQTMNSSQHDIGMFCMDANDRQQQPALQPVTNVFRMSNARSNSQQR